MEIQPYQRLQARRLRGGYSCVSIVIAAQILIYRSPSVSPKMSAISATPASLRAREAGDASVRQVTLSKRDKKYDRQLRLWAASGQDALEHADIVLLNAGSGAVGIETLKNLILPGVGNFTIVDEAEVQEEDLGLNFFLTEDSLGQSRAQQTAMYLQELNPEVTGRGIMEV